jgi:cysteine-rich repeat protein
MTSRRAPLSPLLALGGWIAAALIPACGSSHGAREAAGGSDGGSTGGSDGGSDTHAAGGMAGSTDGRADANLDAAARDAQAGSGGAGGAGGPADAGGAPDGDDGGPPALLGRSCDAPGTLACNGANQRQTLLCQQGVWQAFTVCTDQQSCDRSSGVCADLVPDCAGHDPGYAWCDAGDLLHTCGPDRVTLIDTACAGLCRTGACQPPACGDGKVETGEACDDGNSVAADGCEPDCKPSQVLALTAGVSHTCALLAEGWIRCWGANAAGQLGLGTSADLSGQPPYQNGVVRLGAPAVAIAAGAQHTCALLTDGSVRCWGANGAGQLGLGHTLTIGDDEAPDAATATVALGAKAIAIAAGGQVTCAIIDNGSLRCWGDNGFGQLGLGHTRNIGDNETPTAALAQVPLDDTVTSVGAGGDHTCAVLTGGPIRCWGRNDLGQLGLGNTTEIGDNEPPTAVPAIVFFGRTFSEIVAGATRTFALQTDQNVVHAWGDNGDGGLGVGFGGAEPTFKATDWGNLAFDFLTLDVSAGGYHACVRLQNQFFRCWGINSKGQLGREDTRTIGDNESIDMVTPVDLGTDSAGNALYANAMATGTFHTCALLDTGAVRCWGYNADGQLGLGYASRPPAATDYVGGTPDTIPAKLPAVQVFPPSP